MPTYPDAFLEHWGNIYTSNRLLRRYCSFIQFLARPQHYVNEIGRVLLLEQIAVQRRLMEVA